MSARSAQPLVFEGPDPERLLLDVWSAHGTQARITEPVTVRRGGVFGFFAKLHYRVEVIPGDPLAPEAPRAAPTALTSPFDALVEGTEDVVELHTTRRGSFDEILEKVASALGDDPATVTLPPATIPRAPLAPVAGPPDGGRPDPSASHGVRANGAPEDEERTRRVVEQLSLAGYPLSLLARRADEPGSLAEAFALVPVPRGLPRTPGSLVAVVGDAPRALQLAKAVAEEVGAAPEQVARVRRRRSGAEPVAHLVAHDPAEATDLSPGWRRDRVGVVAVAAPLPGRDATWARAMLRAMAPSMTIALVSATTKPEDVASSCAAIGGVDALLLDDVEHTLTPAAVLATGLPVAALDGVRADASTWAAAAARALERRGVER